MPPARRPDDSAPPSPLRASGFVRPQHDGRVEVLERAVHDLKNPLAVVRASLEWLEVELAGREDVLDAVLDATAASNRLSTIIDDLDTLARLGKSGIAASDPIAVATLVESVVAAATERLLRRAMTVVAITPQPLFTRGDLGLLDRSLSALIDATTRGAPPGACVEVTLRERAAGEGTLPIEIGIALHGTVAEDGAAAGSLDALESAGLGVYVALRAVEAHGGTLEVIPTSSLPRIVVSLPT
jgi:K+-sensing histidine kinase KdpD